MSLRVRFHQRVARFRSLRSRREHSGEAVHRRAGTAFGRRRWIGALLFVCLGLGGLPALAGPRALPGSSRAILGGKASIRLPKGSKGWVEGGLFRVARRRTDTSIGRLTVTAFPADPKLEAASPSELAVLLSGEVLAEVEMRHSGLTRLRWEDLEGPTTVTGASGQVGRVLRAALGRDGTPLQFFVGAVEVRGWVFLIGGVWEADAAPRTLAVADTLLLTLKAHPSGENRALKKKLLGCWDLVPGKRSRVVRGRYVFEADGHFSYTGELKLVFDGAEGFGNRDEHGNYRVHGRTIHTRNDHGEPGQVATRFQGGVLTLGGDRYRRCEPGTGAEDAHAEHDHDAH